MKIKQFSDFVIKKYGNVPTAIVLGSGLSFLKDTLEDRLEVKYDQIEDHPLSTVVGHHGSYNFGFLSGKVVCLMAGRHHFYEGYSLDSMVYYQRVLKKVGVKNLILTNAAGGLGENLKPGDIMAINDYINLSNRNVVSDSGIDLPFKRGLECLEKVEGLKKGCYAYMSGPSFETPAEIRMLREFGVDAVGMSTVPEIRAGREFNKIIAVSCITNFAAGVTEKILTHQEVFETAEVSKERFKFFVTEILSFL
ncbi:MAG: purine-nucleoside phosphorylase [Candidatus Delongbacteria bacterium]|nr:MAG: purine-nucleoside phosphorylase [Candidatus Delongbacteria bacterium]